MRYRSVLAATAVTALAAATPFVTATTSSAVDTTSVTADQSSQPAGSFALSGPAAAHYKLPSGMRELHTATFPDGRTQTRYQQVVDGASVLGGQITIIRSAAGEAETVIGAHFPALQAKNKAKLTKGEAKEKVAKQIGTEGDFDSALRLDPNTGRLFYQVQSIRSDERPVRWVDATTGETINAFDAVAEGEGVGVKGDTKTVDSTRTAAGDYRLLSGDNRQSTYDAMNTGRTTPLQVKPMTDADDVWDLPGMTSPGQPAGVDAHYYAGVVDDFYGDTFGRNSIDDQGMKIISVVHYGQGYCNAFWNGSYMTYGDGNGTTCKSLSGGLDVDGHELTHGVTEHTSGLIYENESGALNEAFSDMMGNTIEFYAAKHNLDPAAKPDFLIGEDVISTAGDPTPGFRNMGDPMQDGDPSHISQKYTGAEDNGGVHTNSGIANHAYYLAVNGGSNASCSANQYHGVLLRGDDCKIVVPALGLDTAAQVFYDGFTSLPEYANFCDARNATVAAAGGSATGKPTATSKSVRPGLGRRRRPQRLQAGHPAPAAVRRLGERHPADRVAAPLRQQRRLHLDLRQRDCRLQVPLHADGHGAGLRLRLRQGRRRERAEHLHRQHPRGIHLGLRPDLDRLGADDQRPGRHRTGLHHRLGDPLLTSRPA